MKVIFECETEVGKCDYEAANTNGLKYAEPDYATLFAHTNASLNGTRGLLKIEQHCYLRHGEELPDQPWIRPEIAFEPALDSAKEMIELVKTMHEDFVMRSRRQLPERILA